MLEERVRSMRSSAAAAAEALFGCRSVSLHRPACTSTRRGVWEQTSKPSCTLSETSESVDVLRLEASGCGMSVGVWRFLFRTATSVRVRVRV